jgi:hypothetical protein
MKRLFALPLILLAACDLPATGTTVTDPVPCMAPTFARFVGEPLGVLDPLVVPQPYRVIRPGDAVTREFIANRMNFYVGADGRLADVTCG